MLHVVSNLEQFVHLEPSLIFYSRLFQFAILILSELTIKFQFIITLIAYSLHSPPIFLFFFKFYFYKFQLYIKKCNFSILSNQTFLKNTNKPLLFKVILKNSITPRAIH